MLKYTSYNNSCNCFWQASLSFQRFQFSSAHAIITKMCLIVWVWLHSSIYLRVFINPNRIYPSSGSWYISGLQLCRVNSQTISPAEESKRKRLNELQKRDRSIMLSIINALLCSWLIILGWKDNGPVVIRFHPNFPHFMVFIPGYIIGSSSSHISSYFICCFWLRVHLAHT